MTVMSIGFPGSAGPIRRPQNAPVETQPCLIRPRRASSGKHREILHYPFFSCVRLGSSRQSHPEDSHMIRVAFVVGDYPPEQRSRREDVATSYASAEVEVGIVSVAARPF